MIKQVAVLGAGVMGTQIAAHFANVGIKAILFDLASNAGDHNLIVLHSIDALKHLKPSPLVSLSSLERIIPANYQDDLASLSNCDLVIEAISERFDWKVDLYKKIAPYLSKNTILATNTSSFSINDLSANMDSELKKNFLGIHFFNPPRYMKLVEMIPTTYTDENVCRKIEDFLVSGLGKNIIYAKDITNFIGNRIGVFSVMSTIYHAHNFNIPPDVVDLLTGTLFNRSKSATFKTLDLIGLDTFNHVLNVMANKLINDPWLDCYKFPEWILELINKGNLGKKSQAGVYKKVDGKLCVIDIKEGGYRHCVKYLNSEIKDILNTTDVKEKILKIKRSSLNEAKFLWSILRDLLHYCSYHLTSIASTVKEVDFATRYGYSWEYGPFEIWQLVGFSQVKKWIEDDIKSGYSIADISLPKWLEENVENGFYIDNKSYCPENSSYVSTNLCSNKKQLFYPETITVKYDEGRTIKETNSLRLWTLDNTNAIVSFKTKNNTITYDLIKDLQDVLVLSETKFKSFIIWQRFSNDFCFGANLNEFLDAINKNDYKYLEKVVKSFQALNLSLRFSKIPTIAAVRGRVLGGGLEMLMHCDRTVAALESYLGLVETAIGIIPGGGGSTELALRASLLKNGNDRFSKIENYFKLIANNYISKSAVDAKEIGYLKDDDLIVTNDNEVLYYAIKQANILAKNYKVPMREDIAVSGVDSIGLIKSKIGKIINKENISEHDFIVAMAQAKVLCGGEIESGVKKDVNWFLNLELSAFNDLIQTKKTADRIKNILLFKTTLQN